jgi:ComF family protein
MQLWEIFKNALFPVSCMVCAQFFHSHESIRRPPDRATDPGNLGRLFSNLMAQHLCPMCARQFAGADSPICTRCGLIFKSREGEDHLCGECQVSEKPYGMARAAGVHDQSLMAVIHAYKYNGKVQLAGPLSKLLTVVCERHWLPDAIDLVLPVPLHPARFRKRGFNQAWLLVRPWGDLAVRDLLQRTRRTSPQTGLGRKERLKNVIGAFRVTDPAIVENRHILLVDDVYTTGATVLECARILNKCGAAQVDILTVGRAVT